MFSMIRLQQLLSLTLNTLYPTILTHFTAMKQQWQALYRLFILLKTCRRKNGLSEYLKETGGDVPGIAYGWSEEEIEYATRTMPELRAFMLNVRKWGKGLQETAIDMEPEKGSLNLVLWSMMPTPGGMTKVITS